MSSQVTLQVFAGALSGQTFTFTEPSVCIVGRHEQCQIKLPDDEAHRTISRFHCIVDISPPNIRVRDFGSLNGTYINDQKIGQRPQGTSATLGREQTYPEHDLQQGDRLQIGETIFRVEIINQEPQRQRLNVEQDHPDFFALLKGLLDRVKGGGSNDDVNLPALENYRVIRPIGEGAFGAVYLAEHHHTGQQVAIKLMLPHAAASTAKVNLFLRETNCLRTLNHPHVVKFIDVGFSQDMFFLVMEYCNGGTVNDMFYQLKRPLTVAEALPIIYQILDGLAYSHCAPIEVQTAQGNTDTLYGIIHRDLKPSNFFLHQSGGQQIIKIGDYGLAKSFNLAGLSGQTVTGTAAGTPVFMSRQQLINFKYVKPEADVWSVAASLYYLLTGAYPRNFPAGTDPLSIILNSPTIPIGDRGVPIPAKLATVIDRALDEGDGKRPLHFATAIEFKMALQKAVKL